MRSKLLLLLLLSGCANNPVTIEQIQIDRSQLVHLSSSDRSMWVPIKKVPPQYPSSALMSGVQGCVNVEFIVDSDGKPKNARIVKAIPEKIFDQVSINATAKFSFEPAATNATRKPMITNNTFTFMKMENQPTSGKIEKARNYWTNKCDLTE